MQKVVKMVNQRGGGGGSDGRWRAESQSKHSDQESKENIMVTLKKVVALLAGVISATLEVKSKTENTNNHQDCSSFLNSHVISRRSRGWVNCNNGPTATRVLLWGL